VVFFHSVDLLIRTDSEKILWPNSPLLVLLQFVGPNVLQGIEHNGLQKRDGKGTLLHKLAFLTDPSDYSTDENQLILGRQLIEHGANVNAVAEYLKGNTPLLLACHSEMTTNLDFIQLLLENGADPNIPNYEGLAPLMATANMAPGAAKCLLKWPTTDVNITAKSGMSFLTCVSLAVKFFLTRLHSLITQTRLKINSCFSSGVKSKRCWCKWEQMIAE
jgi:hypothetical protein